VTVVLNLAHIRCGRLLLPLPWGEGMSQEIPLRLNLVSEITATWQTISLSTLRPYF